MKKYIIHAKSRRQIMLAAIFAAAALTAGIFLHAAQQEKAAALAQEIMLANGKIAAIKNFLQKHNDLAEFDARLTARQQAAEKLFWPADADDADFPATLNYLAGRCGVQLDNLTAVKTDDGADIAKKEIPTPQKKNHATSKQQLNYTTKIFKVTVSGGFWQITDFLAALENDAPFAAVTEWNLKEIPVEPANGGLNSGTGEKTLVLTGTIAFYQVRS